MKKSSRLLTVVLFSFALPSFFCGAAVAWDYSWNGGSSENWHALYNWYNETTRTWAITTPGPDEAADNGYISKSCHININDNVTFGELHIKQYVGSNLPGGSPLPDNWAIQLNGSKKLGFASITFDDTVSGTLEFNCPAACSSATVTTSKTGLVFNSTYTTTSLTADGSVTVGSGGTINATSGNITFAKAITSAGTITAAGNITFNGAVSGASGTISAGSGNIAANAAGDNKLGTVSMSADTTITNSASGKVTIATLSGAHTATLSDAGGGMEVSAYDTTAGKVPSIKVAAGNVSLAGGTLAALTVQSGTSTAVASGLEVTGDLVVDGDLTITGDLTVGGKLTVTGTGKLTVTGALNANGATENEGEINAAGNVSFGGAVSGTNGKITMTGATAALSGSGSAAIANFVYAPSSTGGTGLAVSGANSFTNFTCETDGAKIKIDGANSFTNFTCETDGAKIKIDGANSFSALTVKSGGGTLTVDGALTVESGGTLTLEGKDGSPLNITGSGSITLPETQSSGKYLSVAHGGVKILPAGTSGYYYSAENSSFDSDPFFGGDNNWLLLGDGMIFEWTGDNGTDWADPLNWNYSLVPGLNVPQSPADTTKYPVKIPDTPSGVATNFPVAAAEYTVKSLQVGTSSGAELKLSTAADITISDTLENHGKIIYSSDGRIKKGGAFFNDATGGTVEFASASGATDLSVPSGDYYNLTINGLGEYTAAGAITVKNDFTQSAGTFATSATLNVANALTVSAGNASFNGATSAKTATFSTRGTLALGDGAGDSFTITNGALALPATLGGLTLAGTISAATSGITISKSAVALAAATIFESDLTFGADCTVTGNMTINANLTNNGALKVVGTVTSTGTTVKLGGSGSAEIQKFVYAPTATTGTDLEISSANNTFTNFSCEKENAKITLSKANKFGTLSIKNNKDGTLTVNAAQDVTTTLTLTGKSGHPLTVTGTGSLEIHSHQKSGNYLKVARSGISIVGGYYYSADNSEYSSGEKYGIYNHWVLLNDNMEFVWTGDASDQWSNPSNWNYNLVPGTGKYALGPTQNNNGPNTKDKNVKIPNLTGKPYPVVTALEGYSVGNLKIESSASLTLDSPDTTSIGHIKVKTGKTLEIYGTAIYKNKGRIANEIKHEDPTTHVVTVSFIFINDANNGGTVEFASATGADDLAGTMDTKEEPPKFYPVSYYNLTISGSGNFEANAALTVNNDLTQSAGTLTTNGETTVKNNLTASGGTFTANSKLDVKKALKVNSTASAFFNNDLATASDTSAETATFTTSGTISLGNTADDSFTTTSTTDALNLSGQPAAGVLQLAGTITARASGGITLSHDAALNADTIFASAVSLGAPVTVSTNPAASAFTLTTSAALTTTSGALTLEDASLTNNAAVNGGDIIFTESLAATQVFIPSADSTYTRVELNKTHSGSLTAKDNDLKIQNLVITQNQQANFDSHVTVTTTYSDTGNAGDILFSAGCDFTPATTFNTSGTLTLDGSSAACGFAGGLFHTAGTTTIKGALSATNAAADIELGTTQIQAASTITTKGGNATFGTTTTSGELSVATAGGNASFGDTILGANITLDTQSGSAAFQETLDGAFGLVSNGTGLLTLNGAVGATAQPTQITAAGPATINGATKINGPITITGATTVSAPTIETTGLQEYKANLTFNADCAVTGPVKMTGDSVTLSGSGKATIADFTYEPATTSGTGLKVASANKFAKFTCTKGGATLAINAAQTISGTTGADLTLNGASGSLLNIKGSGSITLSAAQSGAAQYGQYLNVDYNGVSINAPQYYIAENSQFDDIPTTTPPTEPYGENNNWILLNPAMLFKWTGKNGAPWSDRENWNYKLVPGLESATGGVKTSGYSVTIPATANIPDVSDGANYSVSNLTIETAASLTLSSAGNVAASGTLANKGTIFYSGAGRIRNATGAFINDASDTNKGKVEFKGSDAGDLSDVSYYDLIINGSGTYTAATALTVNNDLTQSAGTLTTNGAVTVGNDSIPNSGKLTITGGSANFNASAAPTATSAKTVKFNTTGTISLGNNEGDTFTVSGGALELPAESETLGGLALAGTITARDGITLRHDAALNANTIFASPLAIGAASTLSGSHLVKTSAALDTSAAALTLNDASLTNAATVTGGNIIFTESAPATQTFTPFGSSYNNVTVNKASGGSWTLAAALAATDFQISSSGTTAIDAPLSANGTCQIANSGTITFAAAAPFATGDLTLSNNGELSFNAGATVSSAFTDTSASGNIYFNAGCSFTPQAAFSANGILALNGEAAACDFAGGLSHTAGTTTIKGALNATNAAAAIALGTTQIQAASAITTAGGAASFGTTTTSGELSLATAGGNASFGDTSLGANITLDTQSGSAAFQGTLDGAFDFISNGTGLLTLNGAVGATAPLATITAASPAAVSAPSIATSGLQHYKGDIAFSASCFVSGTVQAAAGITTSGSAAASFADDVWLYTSAAASLGGSGSLSIAKNLFFAGESKTATVASSVSAQNILLLHGTLDIAAGAALSSAQDMIWLGANYGVDDTNEAAASQTLGLFAYNHSARKCPPSFTDPFPAACPDGTAIPSAWTGAVNVAPAATVSAGQNLYANGLSILGSGSWNLAVKDNQKQSDSFAEIHNSTITNCSANHGVAAAENTTATGCSNITEKRPLIKEAWTVYDDAVFISFKDSADNDILIENSENEISAACASISNSAGVYVSAYIDADCQTSTNGAGDISSFYIKADTTWKTDATGISAGAKESSNRAGNTACDAIPFFDIPKALDGLYETLRDSSKNRIAHYHSDSPDTSAASSAPGKTFTDVADKCAPVLIGVLTGQELHDAPDPANPAGQKDYDARNFIEFVYSEPVETSGGTTTVLDSDVNVHAADDLGATTSAGDSGIRFAGLAQTSSGHLESALRPGAGSGSPHALYRKFSRIAGALPQDQNARIRLSIAGWVDGNVSSPTGSFKNWPGYIDSAQTPSGTIVRIANSFITDKAPAKNSLDANSTSGHALPTLSVQNSENELYGSWDITPPSFAPLRVNGTSKWERPATDGSQEYEFVGASYSTGTLSAIELHWFDNEPTYTENLQWFARVGWANASSETEYNSIESCAADIRGGSKPDSGGANKTSGGIRYCSIYNANPAFKYAVDGTENWFGFSQNIRGGANSSLFTYAETESAADIHPTGAEDGLYCKLMLDQTNYSLQTTFDISFDSSQCYITDLAGNRIRCGAIKMKTIDRTPPAFTMTAVPLGTKDILVIFSKALNTDTLTIYRSASEREKIPALENIPKSLSLTDASGTGIQIDKNVPARCLFKERNATGLLLALNQNATLKDITSGVFVTAQSAGQAYDPLAGVPATITYIQDATGNYVVDQSQHAFSDFAVNAVQPQYAYDNSITDEGAPTGYSLYQDGSWAVRDWNAEQANYGTLHAGKGVTLQASLYDGTEDKSGGLNSDTGNLLHGIPSAFFASAPDAASVSTKINENTGFNWRIWQPNFTSDIFTSLAPANNKSYVEANGKENDSGVMFEVPEEAAKAAWKSGDQISFTFKLGDYTVDHYADGRKFPLYAVRLKDMNDITSLDLWSFKAKSSTLQRGGVTILNNVINVENGENTVVQVDMKEAGNLNVIVMTLDGNIIKYLRHGHTGAGTHYYNWNGTNNGGSKVARGLYFVRVIGPGIDETRKVMCVK